MAALTEPRKDTHERTGRERTVGVSAGVTCFAGGGAVLSGGFAEPATTATGLRSLGRFEETVDNSDGADGDKTVRIRKGVFPFANSAAADEIVAADIGNDCYWVDDQTVAKTSATSTRSVAGKVYDVDADGVWVELG